MDILSNWFQYHCIIMPSLASLKSNPNGPLHLNIKNFNFGACWKIPLCYKFTKIYIFNKPLLKPKNIVFKVLLWYILTVEIAAYYM